MSHVQWRYEGKIEHPMSIIALAIVGKKNTEISSPGDYIRKSISIFVERT